MKILTKNWVEKHEQLRFIYSLKVIGAKETCYKDVITKSRNYFYKELSTDEDLVKIERKDFVFNELYNSKIHRNKKAIYSLRDDVFCKIKDKKILALGYASKEDKEILLSYAKGLTVEIEMKAKEANNVSEIAEDNLPKKFTLDDVVGELVYREYEKDKDYFIVIGDYLLCIKNYEIIERENFKINEWEENNPLTLWTALYGAELHYVSDNYYELHLLLVDGDKYANVKYWYFTLKGTDVSLV